MTNFYLSGGPRLKCPNCSSEKEFRPRARLEPLTCDGCGRICTLKDAIDHTLAAPARPKVIESSLQALTRRVSSPLAPFLLL